MNGRDGMLAGPVAPYLLADLALRLFGDRGACRLLGTADEHVGDHDGRDVPPPRLMPTVDRLVERG